MSSVYSICPRCGARMQAANPRGICGQCVRLARRRTGMRKNRADYRLADCPERSARIALYTERAGKEQPLFQEERPCVNSIA